MTTPSVNYSTTFPDESPEELNDSLHSSGHGDIGRLGFFFDDNGEEEKGGDEHESKEDPSPDSKGSSSAIREILSPDAIQEDCVDVLISNAGYRLQSPQHHQSPEHQRHACNHSDNPQRYQIRTSLDNQATRPCSDPISPTSSHQHQPQSPKTLQLKKLVESMKRTEESRRNVMMHRNLLTEEQWRIFSMARERVRLENHQARSHIMVAFFSGSRSTLTTGLEHSRKQLGVYVDQMGNKTL